jgi:DNA (cytosine-5)-methyltransferase 1
MKILNLYAWLWGNRTLWGDEHEVTAVEINEDIAKVYQDRFPGLLHLVRAIVALDKI